MHLRHYFLFLFLSLISYQSQAQTFVFDECFGGDFGGLLTNDNPDVLSFAGFLDPDHLVLEMEGCLVPGSADYNDFFSFQVPEGYELISIQPGFITTAFNTTQLNFHLWIDDDAVPLNSPQVYITDLPDNGPEDPWGANLVSTISPLNPGWYTVRFEMDGWPSTTRYELFFTFACNDNTAPTFTTAPGSLDATLSCSDAAGLANVLAAEPSGTDNTGSVTLNLINDQTNAGSCANSYTRVRTWSLTDGCGNSSAGNFTQTIQVNDNSAPTFTTAAGSLDAELDCDDATGLADALLLVPGATDNCGSVTRQLVSDQTVQDPGCPNAYTRTRQWSIEDECSNLNASNFVQVITVVDDAPPIVVANNSTVAISDPEGYELQPEDVLNLGASYDQCGGAIEVISILPAVLGCDLLNTTVPVVVEVADECGNSTDIIAMIDVIEDTGIHPPWDHDDMDPAGNGDAMRSPCEGTFTLTADTYSAIYTDGGHFVYVELCGDGEITARIAEVNPTGWGGLMIRENMQPGAKKLSVRTTLASQLYRSVRMATNGMSQQVQWPITPGPIWLRLVRTGNFIYAYTSMDGSQWFLRGTTPLTMGNCVLMGLYAESNFNNTPITAVFDNVEVDGGVMPMAMAPTTEGLPEISTSATLAPQLPSIYPNPGKGLFHLDLSMFEEQKVQVEVLTTDGKKVNTVQVQGSTSPIPLNLAQESPGLYIIRVSPEHDTPQSLKLLIQD